MDIATADRLVQLRKTNGLSQEALAEKLGVSRQAVSKWERAEASPDTDNLIALAGIYGMTLDQLLDTTKDKYILDEPKKEETEKQSTLKKMAKKGRDYLNSSLYPEIAKKMFRFPYPMVIVVLYLVVCFGLRSLGFSDPWGIFSLLFLTIPVYYMIAAACRARSKKTFLFLMPVPIVIVMLYLFSGFVFGTWGISAIMFLAIPIYYWYVIFYVKGGRNKDNDENDK